MQIKNSILESEIKHSNKQAVAYELKSLGYVRANLMRLADGSVTRKWIKPMVQEKAVKQAVMEAINAN